jgi:hypothetical protein
MAICELARNIGASQSVEGEFRQKEIPFSHPAQAFYKHARGDLYPKPFNQNTSK